MSGHSALNRPDKLNAFTYDMITQWRDTLDRAATDDAVKVVVLTGAGKVCGRRCWRDGTSC